MKREPIQRSPHEQKLLQRLTREHLRSGTNRTDDYTEEVETVNKEEHEYPNSHGNAG